MGACTSQLRERGAVVLPWPAREGTPPAKGDPLSFEGHTIFKSELRQPSPNLIRLLHIDLSKDARDWPSGMRRASASGAGADAIVPQSAIKVAVLVRPTLAHEHGEAEVVRVAGPMQLAVQQHNSNGVATAASLTEAMYAFDSVHSMVGGRASKQLFGTHGVRVVERLCSGYNASIMAYGQTGSGKTHALGMGRPLSPALSTAAGSDAQGQGVFAFLPSVIRAIWEYIDGAAGSYDVQVKVQFIEILNETVQDLLRSFNPSLGQLVVSGGGRTDVREVDGLVMIDGTAVVAVSDMCGLAEAVDWGNSVRATSSHKLNDQSSRSHAILLITMEQRAKLDATRTLPRELHYLRSRLSLVDLAGSERVKETGNEGARFTEGVHINQSLLTLGKCVNAIVEGHRHVPYRESKLTRVLKDSLGGTAETLVLACVSPAACHLEQTVNTLRYAQRAQKVQNHLKLQNSLSLAEEVVHLRTLVERLEHDKAALQEQVQHLQKQLQQPQTQHTTTSVNGTTSRAWQRPPPVEFVVTPSSATSAELRATSSTGGWATGTVPAPSNSCGKLVSKSSKDGFNQPSAMRSTAAAVPIRCRIDSARDPYEAELGYAAGLTR